MEFVELERDEFGKVVFKQTNKFPITEFPLSKKSVSKEGVVVIYERPRDNPEWHTYYASIDPVEVGETSSSESLVSIIVYKRDVEVERIQNGETSVFMEGGRIVATWCGRHEDVNKNHALCEMLIELYNAWTVVEVNISGFIQHMKHKKKTKYLVPGDQMIFRKDFGATTNNTPVEFGWRNIGTVFSKDYLNYAVDFLKEELHEEVLSNGNTIKTFGIERIPDIMLLKEMEAYTKGLNVDRLVAFSALTAFLKVQQAVRGNKKIKEDLDKNKDKNRRDVNPYEIKKSAFKHLGQQQKGTAYRPDRNPFKNFG
jgi:hypothetical protein